MGPVPVRLLAWGVGLAALRVALVPGEHCPPVSRAAASEAVTAAATWIRGAQRPDGSYAYELDRRGRERPAAYSVVRHAGVTMALYQLAAEGDRSGLATADRGLAYMQDRLLRHRDWAAFAPPGEPVRLGATALMLAGLTHRLRAVNDHGNDVLMRSLARFLVAQQRPDGGMTAMWDPVAMAPVAGSTSRYYTGEAFYALALLHNVMPGEGWDVPARAVADYLASRRDRVEGLRFPPWADQWAAYGLAEMATWTLDPVHVRYARSLAGRFGLLVRSESQRRPAPLTRLAGGPARAGGLGTWGEGLTSLWRLAGTDRRLSDLRPDIARRAACAAGLLASRQATGSGPDLARGAWFHRGATRMDDQQHGLSALLYARPLLGAR